MENIKRRENETDFEYGLRLIEAKCEKLIDLDWQEIVELLNLECHRDSLRKACSVTEYSAYNVMKYFKDKIEKMVVENSEENNIENLIKELEEKTLEFEKEKIRFQDQKREYKNYLRADARFEHLKNEMVRSIKKLEKVKPINVVGALPNLNKKEMVVICSDWHIGLKEKNYWNEVDINIMRERIAKFTNKIIEKAHKENVGVIHLELLGDLVNGLIHNTTRISNEEDVIDQSMIAAEIIAEMVMSLVDKERGNIPKVKIYSATGNHGRCVANAKDSLDTENFERLIPWYLEARLRGINNVEIVYNKYDSEIIVYEFLNETIFAVHGHNDKVGNVIGDLSKMLKMFPTEIHMGHYHSYYEKEDHDMSVVVNGTASGVDKFAKKIRKTSKPTQVCMIYSDEGRECTYKIKL